MKILAFSDVHCDLASCRTIVRAGAAADLVIGAGDFAQRHAGLEETMLALEPMAEKAIYVPGNNETTDALRAATNANVLHGDVVEFQGLSIAGIGGAIPPLPPLPWHSFDLEEDEARSKLDRFEQADILITHSPPKGFVDNHAQVGSIGSTSVLDAVERLTPAFVFCGHVHDSWGQRVRLGSSLVANLGPAVNWFEI